MNYFLDLVKRGYYLRIAKCSYKGVKYTEYAMTKDTSNTERCVACYINLAAKRELINAIPGLPVASAVKEVVHLNTPDSLEFATPTKTPLKITFHQ